MSNHEPGQKDSVDSGAATQVCQQSLTTWEENPDDPEWCSGQPKDISSPRQATRRFALRDVINVAGDFQIARKDTGLLRSSISVGQVCDRTSSRQHRWNGSQRIHWQSIGGRACWWSASIENQHVSKDEVWNWRVPQHWWNGSQRVHWQSIRG